jgi:quercetin dioxygenase-like cupin family protein
MSDIVNLITEYSTAGRTGPLWGCDTGDLNATYLVLKAGDESPRHVNSAVDVIMLVLTGKGVLTLDGENHELSSGSVTVLRKGQERGLVATEGPFSYLNVHKRRVLVPGELGARPRSPS